MFYIVEKPRDRFWTDVKFLLKNSGNLGGNGGGRMAATEVRYSSECRAAVWFVSAFKKDMCCELPKQHWSTSWLTLPMQMCLTAGVFRVVYGSKTYII